MVRERLAAGASVEGFALVSAIWARWCEGTREDGSTIEPNDPLWDALTVVAAEARNRPMAWLEQRHIYGDLADNEAFSRAFEDWLSRIWSDGCRASLQLYLAGNE